MVSHLVLHFAFTLPFLILVTAVNSATTSIASVSAAAATAAPPPWSKMTQRVALGLGYHNGIGADAKAYAATRAFLSVGGRHLDASYGGPSYSDGNGTGAALRDSGVARSEVFITSKFGPPAGYSDALDNVHRALLELNTSYIDLWLIHWPSTPSTPRSCGVSGLDSWRACRQGAWAGMEEALRLGLVKNIGVSNFEQIHLEDIFANATVWPAANQVETHPGWPQTELRAFCAKHNISWFSYAPLGGGWGPRADTKAVGSVLRDSSAIKNAATAHGKTPAQVLLQWHLQQGAAVTCRSQDTDHMKENVGMATGGGGGGFELTDAEIASITALPRMNKIFPDPASYP